MKSSKHLIHLAGLGWQWKGWYSAAASWICKTAGDQGWDADHFINVLAVTSPRVSVRQNWVLAFSTMEGRTAWGMMRSTRAALSHYNETGEIRGPKTGAFARALRGDTTALVLDSWMAVALGVDKHKVTSKKNMAKALRRMERVAAHLGICVRDAQAAVWAGAIINAGRMPAFLGATT